MAKDLLYPEDDQVDNPDYQDYYTTPASPGDTFSSEAGRAVAFDQPADNGIRYPVATPQLGSWQPDAAPSLNGANGGTYVPGSESLPALPGGGYNQAYAADELKSQYGNDPHALQSAIRFQGLQEYKKLIDGGASDSEALRLAAPKLYFNHPAAMNSALKFAGTQNPNGIRSVPVPGGVAILNPNGTIHSVGWDKIPKVVADKVPEDVKQLVKNKNTEISTAEKDLQAAKKERAALPANASQDTRTEAGNAVLASERALKKKMNEAVVARTNYPHANVGPQMPTSAKESKTLTPDSIRADFKAGKISRDEAKKLLKDHGFD